jgi:hypothetical protein
MPRLPPVTMAILPVRPRSKMDTPNCHEKLLDVVLLQPCRLQSRHRDAT